MSPNPVMSKFSSVLCTQPVEAATLASVLHSHLKAFAELAQGHQLSNSDWYFLLQSAADQAGLLVAMMDHGASESIYELRSKP